VLVAAATSPPHAHIIDMLFFTCSVSGGDCAETGDGHSFRGTLNFPVGRGPVPFTEARRHR
jgi:hypothetical protein